MKKQSFIFFTSVIILIILSSYILISSTEKKEPVIHDAPIGDNVEELVVIPKEEALAFPACLYQSDRDLALPSETRKGFDNRLKDINAGLRFQIKYAEYYAPLIYERFEQLFFDDSELYLNFFYNDFFSHRNKLNTNYMGRFMTGLDSMRNDFYSNYSH